MAWPSERVERRQGDYRRIKGGVCLFEPSDEPSDRVTPATPPVAQRDQRGELERVRQAEPADLMRGDLRRDELPASRARRRMARGWPWAVIASRGRTQQAYSLCGQLDVGAPGGFQPLNPPAPVLIERVGLTARVLLTESGSRRC
jgi:hypothetical protein